MQDRKKTGAAGFFRPIGALFSAAGEAFAHGDWKTRLSFLVMGFGCLARRRFVKGLLYLASEILFILYIALFGSRYLKDLGTLGTVTRSQVWDGEEQIYWYVQGDNSMLILLYSVLSIFFIAIFAAAYFANIRSAYEAQAEDAAGRPAPGMRDAAASLLDRKLHTTLLALPTLGVFAFTLLPVIFMILMAFTNFDRAHQPPGNLFTWVGLQNFLDIFWMNPGKSKTFYHLLGWTVIWAVFATFVNYLLGMVLALMINKKGIRFKAFWRTIFVLSIAVPAFVTLLLMRQILQDQGAANVILQQLGLVSQPVHFLTDGFLAKISVILVNYWIGIPYSMLITTGILMNIPADIYESARIDGAGPLKQFTAITLPYMLFITTPYLITQFIANINNFNAIYFLTSGGPLSLDYYQAGETDLLVTWLYKLTVSFQDYNLASTIGILLFVVCSVVSLVTFNITMGGRKEETFA
ncbi:MAG: sugar ABC transporter permease [Clostridiales Family XIII bacterium]|jgi:arabinogalactan oligomer/maltooligosaccharide transport system permease protein|nr:sugar ABC transporter permease [Clostridiales Family XIII bacterium]